MKIDFDTETNKVSRSLGHFLQVVLVRKSLMIPAEIVLNLINFQIREMFRSSSGVHVQTTRTGKLCIYNLISMSSEENQTGKRFVLEFQLTTYSTLFSLKCYVNDTSEMIICLPIV